MRGLDRDLRLLALSTLLMALGAGLYVQLLSVYALQLGASRFEVGWLSAILLATTAFGNLLGAWACEHFSLRTVIVAGRWLTVPAALAYMAAPSWPWLTPGLVLSGLYLANSPAFKSYIFLKSGPGRAARDMTLVYGTYPLGLVVAPLVGGWMAELVGLRMVFLLGAAFYLASSLLISAITDVAYPPRADGWTVWSLRGDVRFTRYVAFFAVTFTAAYLAQPFLAPYLRQVHGQSYAALGAYLAVSALGAAVITTLMGRLSDRRGPVVGVAGVLVALLAGGLLLLAGRSAGVWAIAMFLAGGFDAVRFVAAGLVGGAFERIPLAWGYAVFDASMGVPMAGGALLGGLLYRTAFGLPLVVAAIVAAALLGVLAAGKSPFVPPCGSRSPQEAAT